MGGWYRLIGVQAMRMGRVVGCERVYLFYDHFVAGAWAWGLSLASGLNIALRQLLGSKLSSNLFRFQILRRFSWTRVIAASFKARIWTLSVWNRVSISLTYFHWLKFKSLRLVSLICSRQTFTFSGLLFSSNIFFISALLCLSLSISISMVFSRSLFHVTIRLSTAFKALVSKK